jgi:hypothetical protein
MKTVGCRTGNRTLALVPGTRFTEVRPTDLQLFAHENDCTMESVANNRFEPDARKARAAHPDR